MIKKLFPCGSAILLAVSVLVSACGDTVMANNCKVSCQDVDTTCVKACTDDACKTKCAADLDSCSTGCSSVTVTPPDGGR